MIRRIIYIITAIFCLLNISTVSAKSVYTTILSIEVKPKSKIMGQSEDLSVDMDHLIEDILTEKNIEQKQKIEDEDIIDRISGKFDDSIGDAIIAKLPIIKKPKIQHNRGNLNALISSVNTKNKIKKPVIVIDAGHGGKDSGTLGRGRVKEKDIVLLYAKDLVVRLKKKKKYKVYLTRNRDVFLPLRGRIRVARKFNADLFISVHADAAQNKNARGLSIYTLSEKASGKEAALLARKENKEDIVAGIDLSNLEKDVSDTLIDLSLREAKNKSRVFAGMLYKNLKSKVRVRKNALHSAGFVVLKNPNMASVLLEIGYLSNKYDTKNLRKRSYRKKLVLGISESIDRYFVDKY